ncbi:baseplate multidomain protein megatron [Mongoliimonas terrestris]|uniref:baseplate multidomain protein megatron n=1 Tax=Mongoliimonas terrestris TaxID=1709001 RepID=UPI0009497225|nr:glycoside hydrolase/phage tail family protein [Mongoliimonas terrestris]
MGSLVLSAVGGAVGAVFGPVGSVIGQALGGLAGAAVDRALIGGEGRAVGRLADLSVQTSTEGAAMPRVYGRVRLSGQVIWATRFEEVATSESAGGKGGPTTTTFAYFANVAIGLCEGPVARVGRVWANGVLLDLTRVTMRVHGGDEAQGPDSLIEAKQGVNGTPAYRGTAYVVFERLPLDAYGNSLPQFAFEVIRPVGRLEPRVRAVTLIPGATEFGYAPTPVNRAVRRGVTESENRNQTVAASDVEASLDELQAVCPNLASVAVVVAWFGDDLRADVCTVWPKVEHPGRATTGLVWQVAGAERATAAVVSNVDGRPAFGGTPDDASVVALIRALKARGLAVTLYPFLMMDVPAGNARPDPWSGAASQPVYPWRGRITCHPAPGRPGTPDKTAAAGTAIAAFLGSAARAHFTVSGERVVYAGPAEWRYRRMILHYAHLCLAAGGVETFLVGSELPGLTAVRTAPGAGPRPFVAGLRALAADVKAVLGAATKVSYAADWTEWFGHHPADGSGDRIFHLDPLWADPNVDFVGIDAYWPLADWRDGSHADAALADGPKDRGYLAANVAGGEGFDWYYASEADRLAGARTPITDGAYGKPWMFRFKDLKGWWENAHRDRVGGVEVATPTGWLPGLKPIRFTEIGCPAVDRGANEPNVFPDLVSSEGRAPRFSAGRRDDGMQRRALEAMIGRFDPASAGFQESQNPPSVRDGRRMVEHDRAHVWTWDARPYPDFPLAGAVWADGANWRTGHWITGRMGAAPLDDAVRAVLADCGVTAVETDGLTAVVDGLVAPGRASPRSLLEPLAALFRFTVTERGDRLVFADRPTRLAATLEGADLVEPADGPVLESRRAQAEDAPAELAVTFFEGDSDGRQTVVSARRPGGRGSRDLALPLAAPEAVMRAEAEAALRDLDAARDRLRFSLPPTALALEAGDVVRLVRETAGGTEAVDCLIERIEDGPVRAVDARRVDLSVAAVLPAPEAGRRVAGPIGDSPAEAVLLDLPLLNDDGAAAHRPLIAATAVPWPGRLDVHRRIGDGFAVFAAVERPAVIGTLETALAPGPVWRWDRGGAVEVALVRGTLSSRTAEAVLAGANVLAVGSGTGGFELVGFQTALLVGERRYRLSGLLRGLKGTEALAAAGHPAGATMVLLDGSAVALPIDRAAVGSLLDLRVGPAGRDVGDVAVTAVAGVPLGVGLRPLSPVRLTARRLASGDVAIGWIRRTRIGGDGWAGAEVPLGETAERYRLTVFAGALVRRVIETTGPAATYGAAEQAADFGGPPAALDLGVEQIGDGAVASPMTRRTIDV